MRYAEHLGNAILAKYWKGAADRITSKQAKKLMRYFYRAHGGERRPDARVWSLKGLYVGPNFCKPAQRPDS